MKKIRLSLFKVHALLLCTFFLVNSCKKEAIVPINETQLNTPNQNEKSVKNTSNGTLSAAAMVDKKEIIWEVQWNSKNIRSESKSGISYSYIPMQPKFRNSTKKIRTMGYSRYMLVINRDGKNNYYTADAVDDVSQRSSKQCLMVNSVEPSSW